MKVFSWNARFRHSPTVVARRNIELKARLSDQATARSACEQIEAESNGTLLQHDTYFEVVGGRLKLREEPDQPAQLIAYERADEAAAKESRFSLAIIPEPAPLLAILSLSLGVMARVSKRRDLYIWHGVRIHLDEVAGLGNFLELEAPITGADGRATAEALVDELRQVLGIKDSDLVASSYCDLVRSSRR